MCGCSFVLQGYILVKSAFIKGVEGYFRGKYKGPGYRMKKCLLIPY